MVNTIILCFFNKLTLIVGVIVPISPSYARIESNTDFKYGFTSDCPCFLAPHPPSPELTADIWLLDPIYGH